MVLFKTLSLILRRIRAKKRVGRHNIDILSIIYGILLGDGILYNVKGNCRLKVSRKEGVK